MSFLSQDELIAHLPPYLSDSSRRDLTRDLKQFPKSLISKNFYVQNPNVITEIRQGDVFKEVETLVYPIKELRKQRVVLLTNTCSAYDENKKEIPPFLTFAPLVDFSKWSERYNEDERYIIDNIRNSYLSQAIYYPPDKDYPGGTFALFDRAFSLPLNKTITKELLDNRVSSLSNFGWYFFVFKLSYWYCRMGEKIQRNAPE